MIIIHAWSRRCKFYLTEQETGRFQCLLERRGRAASEAPGYGVQQVNKGMFVRMQPPQLLAREILTDFIEHFQT